MRRAALGISIVAILAQGCRGGVAPVEPHAPRPLATPVGAAAAAYSSWLAANRSTHGTPFARATSAIAAA